MKEFWEEQARKYGEEIAAVNFDPNTHKIAAKILGELIEDGRKVADLGCGNGRALIDLAAVRPQGEFIGYDFAESMVEVAETRRKKLGLQNVRFFCFDATSESLPDGAEGAFDILLGKRLLINIKGEPRKRVLNNIAKMLTKDGRYVMVECFLEPLDRINDIRQRLGLDRIVVRDFNNYLPEYFMTEVEQLFSIEKTIDIGSLYYFISRVFNAYLSEGRPDYMAPINQLAMRLTMDGINPMQGLAPEITHVLRKL
jgi:ubiquinone/menaquinone biosynthesis C-methylase UbiE